MKVLPKLTGKKHPNAQERCLFALPVQDGGLNLVDPAAFAETQYRNSLKVTKPLTELIITQCFEYPYETLLNNCP